MSTFKVYLDRGRALLHPLTSEELALAASGRYTEWAQRILTSKSKKEAAAYFVFMLAGNNWAMANVAVQTGLVERLAGVDKLVLVYAWVDLHSAFLWLWAEDRQWQNALSKVLPLEWMLNLNALNMPHEDWAKGLKVVLAQVEPKKLAKYPGAMNYLT